MNWRIVLAMSVALLTVSVPVYILFSSPSSTEVQGIQDSDGDGIRDDVDFFDNGNGGAKIQMVWFKGKCDNWFGPCKPRFEVAVDVDYDGDYDLTGQSGPFEGDELAMPFVGLFDIPDDATKIRFELRIIDTDGNDQVDWTNHSESRWGFVEVALPTEPQSWSQSGTVVPRASVSFSLSVEKV